MDCLGIGIDLVTMTLTIPQEKVDSAKSKIEQLLAQKRARVKQIQVICGLLNFLNHGILGTQTYLFRIYSLIKGVPQYHHVHINAEARKDLRMWSRLLTDIRCRRSILSFKPLELRQYVVFTNSSKKRGNGYGIFFANHWSVGKWSDEFLDQDSSIALRELYPIKMSLLLWGKELADREILIRSDNQSSCYMLENQTSNCEYCLVLLRIFVLQCIH